MAITTTRSAPGRAGRKRRSVSSAASEVTLTAIVGAAHVSELPRHIREPLQRIARVDVEPEQVAELGDHEHDRDAVQVPDQHRPGEVVGHPAEAQHPGQQEAGRDEQREHRGQLGRLVAARDRERAGRRRRRASRPSLPGR